jgi:hypothetical protein
MTHRCRQALYTERSVLEFIMSKTAIVVFADPKSGGEEALGRLFNAMFLTHELKEKNQDVALIFQGAGSRWPEQVVAPTHPANALYQAVVDKVVGVCGGCADVFGASEGAKASGVKLIHEKAIPGTTGVIDLSRYLDQGYRLVTF